MGSARDNAVAEQLVEELDALAWCSRRVATLIDELLESRGEREVEVFLRGAVALMLDVIRGLSA